MKGYLVQPADQSGKLGTVIVIHENRGLNAHIKDVARRDRAGRLCGAGARTILSPLGGTPTDEEKARGDVRRARSGARQSPTASRRWPS